MTKPYTITWNSIVESGVKHHKPKLQPGFLLLKVALNTININLSLEFYNYILRMKQTITISLKLCIELITLEYVFIQAILSTCNLMSFHTIKSLLFMHKKKILPIPAVYINIVMPMNTGERM